MTTLHNLSKIGGDLTVVLQKLNQTLPFSDVEKVPSGNIFYSVDNFPPAAWNGIPIFHATTRPSHPDHEALKINSIAELRARGLQNVGTVESCTIKDGRLTGIANIWDVSIRTQAERGLLGVSTGFDAALTRDGAIIGPVQPSHLLSFVRCGSVKTDSCGIPNDKHSGFEVNNLEDAENLPSFFIRNRSPPEHGVMVPEASVQMAMQRDRVAVETIKARGRFNAITSQYEDWLPGEGPE